MQRGWLSTEGVNSIRPKRSKRRVLRKTLQVLPEARLDIVDMALRLFVPCEVALIGIGKIAWLAFEWLVLFFVQFAEMFGGFKCRTTKETLRIQLSGISCSVGASAYCCFSVA